MIGRRALIGSAALSVLIAAAARAQPARPYRLAIIDAAFKVEDLRVGGHVRYDALLTELARLGHVEDVNLLVNRQSGIGLPETAWGDLAREAIAWGADIIFAAPSRMALQVKNTTMTVPVVFIGSDPVGLGVVPNLSRPGGNVTGFATDGGGEGYQKHMQLLLEVAPSATRLGVLVKADSWDGPLGRNYRDGAALLGIEIVPVLVEGTVDETSLGSAFTELATDPPAGLVVGVFSEFVATAPVIARLALEAGLPAIAASNVLPEAGLLMSYGPDLADLYRRGGGYIDRILRGARPAEMPIEQPTKFRFVVNLRTAAALGLTLPSEIMAFATEFIE